MGGHIAVPLDKDSKEEDLEFCINEAQCDLIVAAKSNIDQVRIDYSIDVSKCNLSLCAG